MKEQQKEQSTEEKVPMKHSAAFAGGTFLASLPVDLIGHFGPTGLVVGGIASYVAWRHGPELYEWARGILPLPPLQKEHDPEQEGEQLSSQKSRSFWDRALGRFPEEQEQGQDQQPHEDRPSGSAETAYEEGDTDGLFAMEQQAVALPCRRISVNEIVNYVEKHNLRNQYYVWLGRSLTREKNPAVHVNVYKQHVKIIGASQKGKSSMAACILEQLIRTHDVEHAKIAILDLEDRTGRLFENDPHIVTFQMDDRKVKMHARTKEQVLEHLGYILALMEYRYTLPQAECEAQPLLIVYVEEFLALKDHFKRLASGAKDKAKEQAKADYEALIYRINELARRGLKANIQLLLCAQVDYRDDDFVEALANITVGMCFSVKPSAADAAGFTDGPALKKNYQANIPGQAVAEFSFVKDTVLAPDYDLRARLLAYEKQHGSRSTVSVKPFTLGSQDDQSPDDEEGPIEALQPKPAPRLQLMQKPKATVNDAIDLMKELGLIGRGRLVDELKARGLECTPYMAQEFLKEIRKQLETAEDAEDAAADDEAESM